jgi:hypothetical protein
MGEELQLLNENLVTVLNDLLSFEKQLKELTQKVTQLDKKINIKNPLNTAKIITPSIAKKPITRKQIITPSIAKKPTPIKKSSRATPSIAKQKITSKILPQEDLDILSTIVNVNKKKTNTAGAK